VLNALRIHAPEGRGFAMGVASHGIATARAFTESEVAGSFAGLGMVLNAVLTALIVPPVVRLFGLAWIGVAHCSARRNTADRNYRPGHDNKKGGQGSAQEASAQAVRKRQWAGRTGGRGRRPAGAMSFCFEFAKSRTRAPTRPRCDFVFGAVTCASEGGAPVEHLSDKPRVRLRSWGGRTRTRECPYLNGRAEVLGVPQNFRTRDFSRTSREKTDIRLGSRAVWSSPLSSKRASRDHSRLSCDAEIRSSGLIPRSHALALMVVVDLRRSDYSDLPRFRRPTAIVR